MRSIPAILPLTDGEVRSRWNALANACGTTSPFGSPAYADAVAGATGLAPHALLVREDGEDLAGTLCFLQRRGPFREAVIPPFTPFTPCLFRRTATETEVLKRRSATEALLEALERRTHRAYLHLEPGMTDLRVARWRGWGVTPLYTYHLSPGSDEDWIRTWSAGTRRTFRKQAAHYAVRLEGQPSGAVARCVEQSFARQGRPLPVSSDALSRWIDTLQAAGLVTIATATHRERGVVEAAVAFLHAGSTVYYWLAGGTPGPGMTILLGEALPRLSRRGLTTFDFVGANTPTIAEFKRRFGPVLVPYFRIEWSGSRMLRVLQALRGR